MSDDPAPTSAASNDCPVCQVGGVGRLDIDGPPCVKCRMGWDACYDREHDGWCCAECHHHVACDCFKEADGRFGPVPTTPNLRGRGA